MGAWRGWLRLNEITRLRLPQLHLWLVNRRESQAGRLALSHLMRAPITCWPRKALATCCCHVLWLVKSWAKYTSLICKLHSLWYLVIVTESSQKQRAITKYTDYKPWITEMYFLKVLGARPPISRNRWVGFWGGFSLSFTGGHLLVLSAHGLQE